MALLLSLIMEVKMIKTISIKEHNPNNEYAIFLLDSEIHDAHMTDVDVLIVVHGYGSHGVGGLIKSSAMQYLKNARKEANIVDFVQGEHWSDTNHIKTEMCRRYPQLILNDNLHMLNSGVTVVWVKDSKK